MRTHVNYTRVNKIDNAWKVKRKSKRRTSLNFHVLRVVFHTLGSLSSNVFERRTSTGSGLFSFFDGVFAQIFSQIASITVKKLKNTNFISSRHVKRENTSLPVDVRHSKTSLLKLSNVSISFTRVNFTCVRTEKLRASRNQPLLFRFLCRERYR